MSSVPASPYQRGISTLGCPEATFAETLELARRFGLAAVELRALGGRADIPGYFAAAPGGAAALAAVAAQSGIRVIGLSTSLRLADGSPADREQFLTFIPWAEALGVPWLRVFDGGKTGSDAEFAQAAETVRWWRDLRAARGWKVDVMVETHDTLMTSQALRRFAAAIPRIAILWDTHHTWKRGGELPADTWREVGRHFVHLHVKDSVSIPSPRNPYTYVVPGTGEFPMASLRAALGSDFKGIVSFEWEKMWEPHLPTLDQALQSAADHQWW
jgi:sugar phosphate isomerase/epimerase